MDLEQLFGYALTESPVTAYLLVYLAGIAASLTPCVLPVLPIAVGTITATARVHRKTADGEVVQFSRVRALLMGCFYTLGLSLMFSSLGLLAALSGKAVFGMLASSWITYAVMSLIIFALGAWMLWGDNLDPGARLQNWAQSSANPGPFRKAVLWWMNTSGGGAISTFLFGALSGLIAGPCTAPIIALVLAYVAREGNVVYGTTLMFVFGMGLSTLMVVSSVMMGLASALSRKGGLARKIKYGMITMMFLLGGWFAYVSVNNAGLLTGGAETQAGTAAPGKIYTLKTVPEEGVKAADALLVGQKLPDFSWTDGARTVKLSDLKGKAVFMTFWGSWCAECKAEIPKVKKMFAEFAGDDGAAVLSINVLESEAKARAFAAKEGLPYDVIVDAESTLTDRIGATAFPLNMIINADGVTTYSSGKFPNDYKDLIGKAKRGQ